MIPSSSRTAVGRTPAVAGQEPESGEQGIIGGLRLDAVVVLIVLVALPFSSLGGVW